MEFRFSPNIRCDKGIVSQSQWHVSIKTTHYLPCSGDVSLILWGQEKLQWLIQEQLK